MSQEDVYCRALLPEPVVCLKLPLRPFCIGHSILLRRIRSPFAIPARLPEYADLMQAVLFCAGTWEEGERINDDPLARIKIWIWNRRLGGVDFDLDTLLFYNYIAQGSLAPQINRNSSEGRAPGAPWEWRLKNFLVTRMGKTESEAMNFPLGRAQWEYACHYEHEEACEIKNDHDISFDEYCRERDRVDAEKAVAEKGGDSCQA